MILPHLPLSLFLCPYLLPDNQTQNTPNTFFPLVTVLFLPYPNLLHLLHIRITCIISYIDGISDMFIWVLCESKMNSSNYLWHLTNCNLSNPGKPYLHGITLILKTGFLSFSLLFLLSRNTSSHVQQFLRFHSVTCLQNMGITCLHTLTTQKSPCTVFLLSYMYNSRHNVNTTDTIWIPQIL